MKKISFIIILFFFQTSFSQENDGYNKIKKANDVLQLVEKNKSYVQKLTGQDLMNLPLGIQQDFGNNAYILLAFSDAKVMSEYTELSIVAKLKIPESEEPIFLGAEGVKFSSEGAFVGDLKLKLLGAKSLDVLPKVTLRFLPDYAGSIGTYATFNCEGITELSINADVIIDSSAIVSADADGNPIPNTSVKGNIKTIIKNWGDILLEVNLNNMAIPSADLGFGIQKAVLDLSNTRNSEGIIFLPNYNSPQFVGGNRNAWKGVYIQQVIAFLPKMLKDKKTNKRSKIVGNNLLIDNMGVSGSFGFKGKILDQGEMNKDWTFTIDSAAITLIANSVQNFSFGGELVMPLTGANNPFQYGAFIDASGQYKFIANPSENLQFAILGADATIDKSSYIKVEVIKDAFLAEAKLDGKLEIKNDKAQGLSVKNVRFEGLRVRTAEPFLSVDHFSGGVGAKIGDFELNINELNLQTNQNIALLSIDANVKVAEVIDAGGKITMFGNTDAYNSNRAWTFNRTQVDAIRINSKISTFKLEGNLNFNRNHPVYGNGFAGRVKVDIDVAATSVKADAAFMSGTKDHFKYWYFDALAQISPGIPLGGPLSLNAIGGGAYFHCKMNKGRGNENDSNTMNAAVDYIPDQNTKFGFKAAIGLASTGSDGLVNGMVTYEMAFNQNWGVRFAKIYGEAKILTKIPGVGSMESIGNKLNSITDKTQKATAGIAPELQVKEDIKSEQSNINPNGAISAIVDMTMDFENSTFHGIFDAYVNIAGGIIQGRGPNARAGRAIIHVSPNDWYFYIGTPQDRIGLRMGVGPVNVSTGGYFCMGSVLPASPPPPQRVADILGATLDELDYMRDENLISKGGGVAFGSSLEINTGDLTFAIFYARFEAGIGFDIMLKNYGSNTSCKGASGPVGINGWYANGQVYAYLAGELGVKVNLFFIKGRFPIISAGMAALLQAKLPNPVWMQGNLGGYFSVCGGLVSGRFRFKFEIGEKCIFNNQSPVSEMPIIADMNPTEAADNVDVFTIAQASFNMPIDKELEIEDEGGNKKVFKAVLESFKVYRTDNGQAINGVTKLNAKNDAAFFEPHDILPPNTQMKALCEVAFMQKSGGNWSVYYVDGKPAKESKEAKFKTGNAPENIPEKNVLYSYPVLSQSNFFKDESNTGFIQLKIGQPYLFEGTEWTRNAYIYKGENLVAETPISYNSGSKKLTFEVKNHSISEHYVLKLISKSNATGAANTSKSSQTSSSEAGDITLAQNKTSGAMTKAKEVILHEIGYRTSQFNTFAQKLQSIQFSNPIRVPMLIPIVHQLETDQNQTESFDLSELIGTRYSNSIPLVQPIAQLSTSYYQNDVFPLVYSGYPVNGNITVNRNVEEMGMPPAKAIEPIGWYLSLVRNNQLSNNLLKTRFPYAYTQPMWYYRDFQQMQSKAASIFLNASSVPSNVLRYLNQVFPIIKPGNYPVNFRYILPDGTAGTSKIMNFNNITY